MHVCLVRILYSTPTVGDGGVDLVTLTNRIRESGEVGQPGERTPTSAERDLRIRRLSWSWVVVHISVE